MSWKLLFFIFNKIFSTRLNSRSTSTATGRPIARSCVALDNRCVILLNLKNIFFFALNKTPTVKARNRKDAASDLDFYIKILCYLEKDSQKVSREAVTQH